ncbi:hypothetical protein K474DRAFT_1585044 [Panus rudis PR-1116 ss-1]|nr:hypothetical protein K474DRAFT_1585044 [Panus rudis PR-1116 ss-1]
MSVPFLLRRQLPLLRRQPATHLRKYTTVNVKTGIKPTPYGQPLYASHPHLLGPEETTPGIPQSEYERRRRELMDSLPDDSVVICVAGQVKYMSGREFYKFRQASDFWYLTGFEEPDAGLILEKDASTQRGYRMLLFTAGKNEAKEKWEGSRTSFEDVVAHFKADEALPIERFPLVLKQFGSNCEHAYIDIPYAGSSRGRITQKSILKYLSADGFDNKLDYKSVVESISSSRRKPLKPLIDELRAIKSKVEQKVMREAADLSGRAHAKTMRFTEPGKSEHAIAAHFEYLCQVNGAQRLAYVPVVASGPNSLIIHYTSNNQIVQGGEMILIDAGCEYNGYASDITRTYPASGKFTSAQAELYGAVLSAQKELVSLCSEAKDISLAELHRYSCRVIRDELNRIGFNLHGFGGSQDVEAVLYPHYVGHPIGIDLHESSDRYRTTKLKEGMVITVEPGVYVPPSPSFPTAFHNMGVRIEDEVLVGKDHATVLSVNAPKEIADVEAACQGSIGLQPF